MAAAPREGLLPPRILIQFRGEPRPIEAYWSPAFYGWIDDGDGRTLPIVHNPMGWCPAD